MCLDLRLERGKNFLHAGALNCGSCGRHLCQQIAEALSLQSKSVQESLDDGKAELVKESMDNTQNIARLSKLPIKILLTRTR